MIVRELITVLGFKADEKPLDKINSGVNRLKKSLGALAAIGTATATAIYGLAQSTANTGDEAAKLGRAVGLTAEEVQEYNHASSLAGLSSREMEVGLRQISRAARDAGRGVGSAKQTLDELGISLSNADGTLKSTDQMVEAVADRFQKMPDGPEKTAAAMDLFGRSGAKMINLLNEGGDGIRKFRQEAHDLGVVIDNETAAKAEEFNDTIFRMRQFLTGLKHLAGAELIPIFIEHGKEILKWAKANRELIKTRVLEFVEAMVKVGKAFLSILKVAAASVYLLSKLMGGLENVIKFATFAMLAFVAVQIGSAIFGTIQVVIGLAAAFKSMGFAAMIAWIKAAAPIAAVIALILGVVLLVQDFVGWTQGKDSMFGRLFGLENTEENIKKVKGWLIAILAVLGILAFFLVGPVVAAVALVGALIFGLVTYWDEVKAAFLGLGTLIGEKLGEWFFPLIDAWETAKAKITHSFKAMVDTLMGWAKKIFGTFDKITGGAKKVMNFVKFWERGDKNKSGAQLAGAYVGGGAAGPQVDAQRRINQVANTRSNEVNVGEVSVNIQGATDMTPEEMSRATEDGINQALRRQVENASEAFDGGEDY